MAADARAMLRATRDARKVHHPHATYAGDNLSCAVCRTVIKIEAQWDSHIRSPQHAERLKALKSADAGLPNRKRKAEDRDTEQDEVKRSRVASAEAESEEVAESAIVMPEDLLVAQGQNQEAESLEVNDEEWNAFERDLKGLESAAVQPDSSRVTTNAIISAGPIKAEDLAAQAREAQSQQRGAREEELEAEDEEAAVRTNEEAEEMERLQERMKILRERREALRRFVPGQELPSAGAEAANQSREVVLLNESEIDEKDNGEDDEDEDDADEWEGFGYRR